MRLHRGLRVGACLLLAAAGCGKTDKTINGGGTYSPIITTISSNFEPAARGTANTLTVQVTNVNSYPLKYHWQVQAGTLGADSTGASVTWTPPDSIATYDVTASIETVGAPHFFRTMTVHMAVDNEYIRWTHSDQVQFDPAPTPNGGVMYAEFHNVVTGNSDAYRVDTPLGGPIQLTTGFFSVTSPTPRADQGTIAFTATVNSSEKGPALYQLPYAGGDAASAQLIERRSVYQSVLAAPRFPFEGKRLLYTSDSVGTDGFNVTSGNATLRWHDSVNPLLIAPVSVLQQDVSLGLSTSMVNPSWGPDVNGDGDPDSVMALGIQFPGTLSEIVSGMFVIPTPAAGNVTTYQIWLPGVALRDASWSPDGKYVVFTQVNPGTNDRDIWILNRAANSVSQAKRITFGPADDSQPRWSADGKTIFFISNRADRYGVTGVLNLERRGDNVWSVSHFDRP